MDELDVRYSTLDDGKHLIKWLSEKENLKWFPPNENEVKDYANNWIGFARYKCSLTATLKGNPCGIITLYLMPYKKVAHLSMFYMIVAKEHRRKGVGSVLIKNMMNLAEKYFSLESIYAEVFDGCPIIPILEKLDFTSFGKQPHFVKEKEKYMGRIHYEYVFNKEKKLSSTSIRCGKIEDKEPLVKWLMQPGILRWFPMIDVREAEDSARIWFSHLRFNAVLSAVYDGVLCGSGILYIQHFQKFAHQCLFAIIVDEKYRNKGIGTVLMEELTALAKERFQIEILHLEVYEGNPAISLYERLGFDRYGVHKNFLKEEKGKYRDKILMQKNL